MSPPLPDQLRYLESVLRSLSALPPEDLDEDVDTSALEAALRARVKGLSIREAQERLAGDRHALEAWLKQSPDRNGSGAWVVGFLGSRPGAMARALVSPLQAERPVPASSAAIYFEPPQGWSAKPGDSPASLTLWKNGRNMGGISFIKPGSVDLYLRRFDAMMRHVSASESWTKSAAQYGDARGYKYLYSRTAPVIFKNVRYVLEVPGGAVEAVHGSNPGGAEFYESAFEEKLRTLRVTPAA